LSIAQFRRAGIGLQSVRRRRRGAGNEFRGLTSAVAVMRFPPDFYRLAGLDLNTDRSVSQPSIAFAIAS
jgi:hypothetical protein